MKHVQVLMSTYNGMNSIKKQLDSIFNQKFVDVSCIVRDDGSTDGTIKILKEYQKSQPKLKLILGDNIGWKRSFLELLNQADNANYYAFSDQDDIWFENKLIVAVEELEKHNNSIPLLFHCNRISTYTNLKPLPKQAPKVPKPLSKENALTQEYAQGCSIVINKVAKDLVCKHRPKKDIPHDFWTGLICYYFGEVYYCEKPLFYHINHGKNESGAGHIHRSRVNRVKKIFTNAVYINPAKDLLEGYNDYLSENDKVILKKICNYKNSFNDKLQLLLSRKLRRVSLVGTILFKMCILMNKF